MSLSFANPWFLLLLPLPLLVAWARYRRGPTAIRYSSLTLFEGIKPAIWRPRVVEALRTLGLIALVLAMSGPRTPDLKTRVETQGIAIMIVVDTSGSMEEKTFPWEEGQEKISRKEAAKRAFHLFVGGGDGPGGIKLPGRSTDNATDAIGVVTFSTWPQTLSPPTLNHQVILNIIDNYRPASLIDTHTNIGDAIAEATIRLNNIPARKKVIILLSDGEHNVDFSDERQPLKPRQAATLAANAKTIIYSIDCGGDAPGDDKEGDEGRRKGQQINREIAEMTGGKYFPANDGEQLLAVCSEIDKLEKQPLLSPTYRRYQEFYPWAALGGVACIILSYLLRFSWAKSIP